MTYKMDKELEKGLRLAYDATKSDKWLLDHFEGIIRINGKEFPINGFIGDLITNTVYVRNGRYDSPDRSSWVDIVFRFNPEASFDVFKQTIAWMVAYNHNVF